MALFNQGKPRESTKLPAGTLVVKHFSPSPPSLDCLLATAFSLIRFQVVDSSYDEFALAASVF